MSKHILNYYKFLNFPGTVAMNESVSSSPGNFIKEAIKALTDGGMTVEVLSTDRQLKNDNLFCKISFPKIVDFIKEYYDFDYNTQVAYTKGNNLKQQVKNLSLNDIVFYSRGYMKRTSKSNAEFQYSSVEEMVQETKIFFAKVFIYSSTLGSEGQILFPKRRKKILLSDNFEKSLSKAVQSQHSRNLPDGVKKIFNQIDSEFSKTYDLLYPFDEDNCKMITLMLCSLAEIELLNTGFEIGEINATFFTEKSSGRGFLSQWKFYSFDYSQTKKLFTRKDTFRILDEVIVPGESWWQLGNIDWFSDYRSTYLKLQKMSQKELDTYFEDFFQRKRGTIMGKKFGI